MKKLILGLSLFLLVGCSNDNENDAEKEMTVAEFAIDKAAPVELDDFDVENYGFYGYKDIMRSPEEHQNKKAQFFGTVLQVINEGEKYSEYLMTVGSYSPPAVIYAVVENERIDQRLLEGDSVTLFGEIITETTYETKGGDESNVPLVYLDLYSIKE